MGIAIVMENENPQMGTPADTRPLYQRYWHILLAIGIAGVLVVVGAILVIIRRVESSAVGLYGEATLDQWSLAWVVEFGFALIFWILLIVGVPISIAFGLGWYFWWNRLSETQQRELNLALSKDHTKHKGNGGGFGLIMFIAYCIYVASQGHYHTPFGDLPYSYWVYAYLWTLGWLAIIIGIPVGIGALIYFFWYRKN